MPIQIDVFGFKCFNQLRNGEDFSRNLSDFTPNLVGNIGETVKVEYLVNIAQSANTEGIDEWEIQNDVAVKEIRRNSGSFLEDGIQIGDVYEFYADWAARKNTGATAEYTGTVDFISSDGLTIRYSVTSGTDSSNGVVTNVGLAFDQFTSPSINTALFVKFGLISNGETFNSVSKTTEAEQAYYAGSLQPSTTVQAESLGVIKDWVSGEMNVEFSNTIPDFKAAQYIVTHEFVLNPFYILAYREFVENGTVPDLLAGENSIKYAAELEFRKTLTDTGSSKIQQFDGLGGFVGWYGENFNGLNADYRIVSVSYEEAVSGDLLDAININTPTKAIVTVENVNGAITDYSCAAYLFRVPNSEDNYIGTTTNLLENFLFRSDIVSSPDTSSPNIATSLVGGNLVIEYTVDYTVAEKLQLTTDDEFILLVQVEDPTVSIGDSDRIMLLADFKNYVDVDFLSQFINVESYGFLVHDQELGQSLAKPMPTLANEDGFLLQTIFGASQSRGVVINSISASLIAYNVVENKSFELDNYDFAIGDTVFSGGRQQIALDTTRGYPLLEGDQFNLVQIESIPQQGDSARFELILGQKIKWQDWIFNPGVDGVFFDPLQPNNNLNEKISNYSGKEGYTIRLALTINVTGQDDLGRTLTGDFIEYGGAISVEDYDESQNGVSGLIETFDVKTGNSLQGGILLNGEDTLFRTTFQNAADMEYAIHRIEPSQNQGDGILELSSLLPPVSNNLLKATTGNLLSFNLNGSELVTECLIDGSLIQEGVQYKLSARTSGDPVIFDDNYALFVDFNATVNNPGVQQYVIPQSQNVDASQDWSVEFRAKSISFSPFGDGLPYFECITGNGSQIRIEAISPTSVFTRFFPLGDPAQRTQYAHGFNTQNNWMHLVMVWEQGVRFSTYVNGVRIDNGNKVNGNPTVVDFGAPGGTLRYLTYQGGSALNITNNNGFHRGFRFYQGVAVNNTQAAQLYNNDAKEIQPIPASLLPFLNQELRMNQQNKRTVVDTGILEQDGTLPLGYTDSELLAGGGAWRDVTNE